MAWSVGDFDHRNTQEKLSHFPYLSFRFTMWNTQMVFAWHLRLLIKINNIIVILWRSFLLLRLAMLTYPSLMDSHFSFLHAAAARCLSFPFEIWIIQQRLWEKNLRDLNLRSSTEGKWQWKSLQLDTQKMYHIRRIVERQLGFFLCLTKFIPRENVLEFRHAAAGLCKMLKILFLVYFCVFYAMATTKKKHLSRWISNFFATIKRDLMNLKFSFTRMRRCESSDVPRK